MGRGGTSLATVVRGTAAVLFFYACSTSLVIYNKWLLSFFKFTFPLSMTLVHMVVSFLLAQLIVRLGSGGPPPFDASLYWRQIIPVGVMSGLDVAFTNISFLFLHVSFIEMVKSSTPVWVLVFAFIFGLETIRWSLTIIMLMISAGVAIASWGEAEFHVGGFALVLAAAVCAGGRMTVAQGLLQGASGRVHMNPLHALYFVAPVMALVLLPMVLVMEGAPLMNSEFVDPKRQLWKALGLVLAGSVNAFLLHVSELLLVRTTSALTLVSSGVLKLILITWLSVEIFHNKITQRQLVGFGLALVGLSLFSAYKWQRQKSYAILGDDDTENTGDEEIGLVVDQQLGDDEGAELSTPEDDTMELVAARNVEPVCGPLERPYRQRSRFAMTPSPGQSPGPSPSITPRVVSPSPAILLEDGTDELDEEDVPLSHPPVISPPTILAPIPTMHTVSIPGEESFLPHR